MAERTLEELEKILDQHANGAAPSGDDRLQELEAQATAANQPGMLEDAAKGAASGLTHDVVPSTLGMFGDAPNFGKSAGMAVGGWLRGLMGKPPLTEEQVAAKEKDPYGIKAEGGVVPDISFKGPTTEDVKKKVEKVIGPEYKPVYETGKLVKNTVGMTPALLGSPLNPRSVMKYAAIPGVLSQGAHDAAEHLGAYPWAQDAAYALGGLIPATLGARKSMAEALMTKDGIDKAKSYLGMIASGAGVAAGAHHIGVPNEALFASVFGHLVVPDMLKNLPGKLVFGGKNTKPATVNDAMVAALIGNHALQGSGSSADDSTSSPTP